MNKKLYAFGCSYTYGHGLEDCIVGEVEPAKIPSQLGYANIVGEAINRDVLNLSDCGSSNKQITHHVKNVYKKINSDDAVICQWSFMDRYMIFDTNSHNNIEKLGPWIDTKPSKSYYKFIHTDLDCITMTSWYINYTDLMIKSRGTTKVLHTLPPVLDYSHMVMLRELIDDTVVCTEDCLTQHHIDTALDNNHPGQKSHNEFAESLLSEYGNFLK